jgi:hypothetical protein
VKLTIINLLTFLSSMYATAGLKGANGGNKMGRLSLMKARKSTGHQKFSLASESD